MVFLQRSAYCFSQSIFNQFDELLETVNFEVTYIIPRLRLTSTIILTVQLTYPSLFSFIFLNTSRTLFFLLHPLEPRKFPVSIIGDPDTRITVAINSPISLHCYAVGWPRPHVTWWREDEMLPLFSENYEQDSDYSLLIRSVTLTSLGVYTCQAYNAMGKAASWSATLQAVGPVYNVKPEHQEYTKYLVQAPKKPTTTEKPQYPYRPTRTPSPEYQTFAPIYPSRSTHYPPFLPTSTVEPAKFKGETAR